MKIVDRLANAKIKAHLFFLQTLESILCPDTCMPVSDTACMIFISVAVFGSVSCMTLTFCRSPVFRGGCM